MTCDNGTGVELVALQSVGRGIVIETIGKCSILMAAVDHNTCHTTAGSDPHIMFHVFGNTADIIITKTLLLGDVVEVVVVQVIVGVQHVQSLTCTYPDESA